VAGEAAAAVVAGATDVELLYVVLPVLLVVAVVVLGERHDETDPLGLTVSNAGPGGGEALLSVVSSGDASDTAASDSSGYDAGHHGGFDGCYH
jgi:hypothetical protein